MSLARALRDWNALAMRLRDLVAMAEIASEEGGESLRGELEQELSVI